MALFLPPPPPPRPPPTTHPPKTYNLDTCRLVYKCKWDDKHADLNKIVNEAMYLNTVLIIEST